MKKNNSTSIVIAIFTIITTLIWIGSNIYHISMTSTIPEDMKQVVLPFDPSLDTKIFEELKTKKDPADFRGAPISSESAQISPSATNSGQNQ